MPMLFPGFMRVIRPRSRLVAAALLWVSTQGCVLFAGSPGDANRRIEHALATGDTSRAVKLLGGVVRRPQAPAEAYVQLGVLLRSRGTIRERARSQEILERGIQLYPDHVALNLELGKTYYRQTLYGDAARYFRRALELQPNHCEAQWWLAKDWYRKWRHVQVYKEYLQKARSYARQVVACDPDNERALHLLAFSLHALGDTTEAVQRIAEYMAKYPDEPDGYLMRASIEFERLQYEECEAFFARGAELMNEDEVEALESIVLLLDDDAAEEYENRTIERQAEQRWMFWLTLDPDPTTPLNERHLEHLYRMFLADQYFRHDRPPLRGWETERGRALVKFGWPQAMGSTLAGDFTSGRMEIWQYANSRNFFTLYFRDEFLNGNYMVPMDYSFSMAAQTLFLEEPTTTYVSPYGPVPGLVEMFAFRNGSYSSEVHVAAAIDADSMGAFFNTDVPQLLFARSAIFDGDWQPLQYGSDTLNAAGLFDGPPGANEPYYLVKRFELGFGQRRLALCIEDDLARTQAILQDSTNTVRFLGDSLVLSDIVLHTGQQLSPAAPAIRRGAYAFLPNPGHIYGAGQKLRLYFEIYNLQVRQALSRYDVSYSIYEAKDSAGTWERIRRGLDRLFGLGKPPDPVISQTIERSASAHKAEEDLAIDIDALRNGGYILRIIVVDRTSGEETSAEQAFVKIAVERAADG